MSAGKTCDQDTRSFEKQQKQQQQQQKLIRPRTGHRERGQQTNLDLATDYKYIILWETSQNSQIYSEVFQI